MLSEAFSHEFIVIRSIHHLSTQHSLLDIFNFDGVYKEQSQKCYAISFSCLLHRRAHTSTSHDVIIHRLFITQWAKRERGIGNQEYKRRRENTEEKKIDWTTISRLYMKYKNGVWFNCEVRSRCAFSLKKQREKKKKKRKQKNWWCARVIMFLFFSFPPLPSGCFSSNHGSMLSHPHSNGRRQRQFLM